MSGEVDRARKGRRSVWMTEEGGGYKRVRIVVLFGGGETKGSKRRRQRGSQGG